MTIMNIIRKNALKTPNKIAIVSYADDDEISYERLVKRVESTACNLRLYGIDKGTHVATILPNSISCVIIMLSIADLGAVWIPFATSSKPEAIDIGIKTTNANFLISNKNAFLKNNDIKYIDLKKINNDITCNYEKCDDGSLAYILTMTSGSTGDPKPIVFSQNTKLNRSLSAKEIYELNQDDVILAGTPMYHSLAQRLVLLPLLIGAKSIIMKGFSVNNWLNVINKELVTFTISVSSQLESIVLQEQLLGRDLNSLKTLVSSSAPISIESKRILLNHLNCKIHECYGASELGVVTDINLNDSKYIGSVGKPIPNTLIKIIDPQGRSLPKNNIGEISVKNTTSFLGYYNQNEKTSDSFIDDYFLTGDLGYLDDDGFLYYTGRKKEIIITGGINIYPVDIENCLLNHPGIKEVAAFGVKSKIFGELPVCVVVLNDESIKKKDLRLLCKRSLSDYQIPIDFIFVGEIPRTSLGKIRRNLLSEIYVNKIKHIDTNSLLK